MKKTRSLYIYLVSRTNVGGYDTINSFVVIAHTPSEAKATHPNSVNKNLHGYRNYKVPLLTSEVFIFDTWVGQDKVTVELLGKASPRSKPGVVCASFNAG